MGLSVYVHIACLCGSKLDSDEAEEDLPDEPDGHST